MDAPQFMRAFGHVAKAPGGISKLRELILWLAVHGQLVAQSKDDEPTEAQLKRIKFAAQARVVKPGRRKTARPSQQVAVQNIATLPAGWSPVRLKDLVEVLNGRAYSKQELLPAGTPVLRVGNLFTSNHWYYSDLELEPEKYCNKGDLLYAWSASFGPFIWSGDKVIYHYHIWKLDLFSDADLNKQFLHLWLSEKTQEIKAAGHGISMAHMTKEKFEQLQISLPPLAEQARIVAKVNELMTLCDTLESQQQARRQLQTSLRQASLQALEDASSPHDLQTEWARTAAVLRHLFDVPSDVADLRALITSLAIRGSLKTQSVGERPDSDEPATAWGEETASELTSAPAFDLPQRWCWTEMAALLTHSESGWSPKCDPAPRKPGTWGVLKVSAVTWGTFNPDENKQLPVTLTPRPEFEVRPGDFLLSRANTAELVARSVVVPPNSPPQLMLSDKIVRLQFVDEERKAWANLVNNSEFARAHYRVRATGTSESMRNVSRQVILSLPMPLPPMDEQAQVLRIHRELTEVCEQLEIQLEAKQALATHLATATIAAFTGATLTPTEAPMKAPPTELIAPLRLGRAPDVQAQAPLATLLAQHQGTLSAKALWQRFGGEIDAFYAQLKTEVAHGWIETPEPATVQLSPQA